MAEEVSGHCFVFFVVACWDGEVYFSVGVFVVVDSGGGSVVCVFHRVLCSWSVWLMSCVSVARLLGLLRS